jgi:uncharacterized repeat protein (TIGR01451 family)
MNAKRLTAYRVVTTLVLLVSALGGLFSPPQLGGDGGGLLPPRAAQASSPDLQAAIAGGYWHTCALKGGQVYCWGDNDSGQLGDGTTTDSNTPTLVADGAMGNSGVTAVAAGAFHTCAIKSGALYCWGYNGYGQLGNGTYANSTTPVAVTNMGSGVTAVAAGVYHTCAIKFGALYCWGYNWAGQLGNGTHMNSTTPVAVTGMGSGVGGVTAVAAGYYHTCAIQYGALYCWGWNEVGQLGMGSWWGQYPTPVRVVDGDMGNRGVTAVAAGAIHTCAIRSGALYCWGGNGYGQLGDGGTTNHNDPYPVRGMRSGVAAVAAGWEHTCAIKSGALYCWGANGAGQLGNGTSGNYYTTPVAVTNMGSGVTAVAGGYRHTLGLKDTTCLFAWGWNDYGQLGDGGTTERTTPVQVSGGCGWGTTLPAPFSKTAPVSGAVGLPTTVVLSWTAPVSGTVDHYRYCLATTPGCAPSTQVPSTTTSVTVSGLTPGATYHWQVRACADSGCTVFTDANGGAHWSFTVESAIGNVDTGGATGTRKEVTPTAVRMGELVTYTIVISNAGSAAVTARVTDTLAVSATLVSATPGYAQSGQTLVWSGVNVPAGGTAVLTVTVRAASGPLPEGYTLFNSMTIGAADGEILRNAPAVQVEPWRAFVPIVQRPPELAPRLFIPMVMRP